MNDLTDLIWAYIHGELSPENKVRFETTMDINPSLRKALEERRATHEELKRNLAAIEAESISDEQLEEQLLAEWEAEHPEFSEPQKQFRHRIIAFCLPAAAAAAAIFIFMAFPWHQGPVRWERTVYGSAPQLRGHTGTDSRYSLAELKRVNGRLRQDIERSIEELPTPPDPWKLQISLQELANGYLAVEVVGHPLDYPGRSKSWNENFHGMEHFETQAPLFAKRIVGDLGDRNAP